MRVPNHIGIIPDGNRRWAVGKGMSKEMGYDAGLDPGLKLYRLCKEAGVKEITYYGFTVDNTKRPSLQTLAFTKACTDAVKLLAKEDAQLLVIGNSESKMFPKELIPYTTRQSIGNGGIRVNFLVNYGWEWDLNSEDTPGRNLKSSDISRVDLIIRWGGRRRLSGFLPVQSVYADFYIIDDLWPDFKDDHFHEALRWYDMQDVTLGG
jgi:undecaprenyl diphosphate synthase